MWLWLGPLLGMIGLAVGVLTCRRLRVFSREVQLERARELFKLQRERLEAQFLAAAAATGKPRGLRWQDCSWDNAVEFVRERATGHIAALVAVTIQFEAVAGGDLEGLPTVAQPRNGSAVFFFQAGHWLTVGQAIFNMSPHEAVARFGHQYERVRRKDEG